MNIKIKVPTDLNEVTLGQYQRYLKIQESNKDETFVAQKMIEIFCVIPLRDVMRMRWSDVKEITSDITSMFDEDNRFVKTFTLKGQEYGFIPNLDEISFGEFIDLDQSLQDWQEMHHAMNVLYRPIDIKVRGRYNIQPYKAILDDRMKDMPLSIALGAVFFLLNLGKELSAVTMDYISRGILKDHIPAKEGSIPNGDTIAQFTKQLKEILQGLNISQSLGYTKY